MENIKNFETFIKESIFYSKYGDIIKILSEYIKKAPASIFTHGKRYSRSIYSFVLKKTKDENDPYGEEIWEGEDVEVMIEKEYDFMEISYSLYINGDKVDASFLEIRKLFIMVKRRYMNREKEERDLRIRNSMKKFQDK